MKADFKTRAAALQWIKDNGGEVFTGDEMLVIGTYNCNCGECDVVKYWDKNNNLHPLTICEFCGQEE